MTRSLKEKLAPLDPARREAIEDEADRLYAKYLLWRQSRGAK